MYRQIELAIMPELSLGEVLRDWKSICLWLSEGLRTREHQISKTFFKN